MVTGTPVCAQCGSPEVLDPWGDTAEAPEYSKLFQRAEFANPLSKREEKRILKALLTQQP